LVKKGTFTVTILGTCDEGLTRPAGNDGAAGMPRFYFHIYDGVDQIDTDGTELPD
jgi:hypothetical protein